MWKYVSFLFFYVLPASAQVTAIVATDSTTTGACPPLTRYATASGEHVSEQGVLVGHHRLPCRVEQVNHEFRLCFDSEVDCFAEANWDCATVSPKRLFNARRDGHRVGIWVWWYPWGKARRVVNYSATGLRKRVIHFRPTGVLRNVRLFRNGRPYHLPQGTYHYTRQGKRITGEPEY